MLMNSQRAMLQSIRSFDVELVDEKLNPVPLHEVYIHHWTKTRYFQNNGMFPNNKTRIVKRNSGPCENLTMPYYWGLGGESRGVISDIPEPYGIEVGNPSELPKGYDEKWLLNVMTIDTRGAIDKFGCTEYRYKKLGKGKDKIDDEDITFQRMVAKNVHYVFVTSKQVHFLAVHKCEFELCDTIQLPKLEGVNN
ncbi:hypothetical protein RIF29_42292 [Crotalaria pallida]|uniref:Uncharacterized protein n=1 Tax=Crotalaria pallida TaxID=3830 RepID=A0AAN9HS97_CROPI